MATLTTIGGVAIAMGPSVEKASKGILLDILKCLGDNKKHMRECSLTTLDSWLAAAHLDKMVPYITAALIDTKIGAEGRKDLFDWLSKQLTGQSDFPDAAHLLKPAAIAMADKSSDVRKAAEACMTEILRVSGHEAIEKNLRDIQGPALALVQEKLRPHGVFHESFESTKVVAATAKNSSKVAKSASNGVSKHGNKVISSRGVPLRGSRPESILSAQDAAVQSQSLLNVKDSNKEDRERMVVRRLKFEEMRIEQIQDLENDMMRYFREDLHRRLLSTDFKKTSRWS
jgi:cytoskeleton-associated protein 5